MKRNNGGFTLVELLVIIAASSIVMLAAASLLMLGVRVQRAAQDEAGEQQTVRIVLSALENLSASGKIKNISQPDANGWAIYGDDSALLRYWADEKALRAGDDPDGAVLVDGLESANIQLVGSLLTFRFNTEKHDYSTSVYCRTQIDVDVAAGEDIVEELNRPSGEGGTGSVTFPDAASLTEAEKAARYAFLQVLAAQYGSTGQIMNPTDGYSYYSQWYINGYENDPRWNEDTPWCACFLSWAAAQQAASLNSEPPRFADVDDGKAYFQNPETLGLWGTRDAYTPIPGDYVFFDWSGGSDPDHAGAVLCVEGGKVYTIEGNSNGQVAVHSYSLSDPRIVGYGVLDWNKGTETTE